MPPSRDTERALYALLRGSRPSLLEHTRQTTANSALDISRIPEPERTHFIARMDERAAMQWLQDRTVCICHATAEGNPTATGSGVLLRIADVGFIVSAGHVLCKTENDPNLYLLVAPNAGDSGLVSMSYVDITRTNDVDNVDFGFARLPAEIDAYLAERKTFVRLADLALESKPTGGAYTVFGYPREWAKLDPVTKTVSLRPLCFTTNVHRGTLTAVKEGITIALAFPPGGYSFVNGPRERVPELNGISGCGIWRMYGHERVGRLREWDTAWIRLAGIEHAVLSRKAIKGVLISHVVDCIAERYPELEKSIDLVRQQAWP